MTRRNNPLATSYQVKRGDSLWKIAQNQYGDGNVWPIIAKANAIKRPELILSGQRLQLPALTDPRGPTNVTSRTLTSTAPKWKPAPSVAYPTFEFDLEDVLKNEVAIRVPGGKATLSLTGKIKIQRKGVLSDITVSNFQKISIEAQDKYAQELNLLVGKIEGSIDLKKNKLEFSAGLMYELKLPGGGKQTYTVKIEGRKIIFSSSPAPVQGSYKDMILEGVVGYKLTFEPDDGFKSSPKTVTSPFFSITKQDVIDFTFNLVVAVGVLVLVAVVLRFALPVALTAGAVVAFLSAYRWIKDGVPILNRSL
jgi:LysM repeat protein